MTDQGQPEQLCERCRKLPATDGLFRSGTLLADEHGRIFAEVDGRVHLCRQCWEAIAYRDEPLPPGRIIRRFDQPES